MLAPNEDIKIPAILTTLLKCHAVCVYSSRFCYACMGIATKLFSDISSCYLKKRRNIPSSAKHQMRKYVDCR